MERDYKIYNINELSPGDHLCVLYQTDEEHKALITPYLRSGLENNEKVFYIVDARTSETVLDYLRDDGIDVDPFLESGQLAILSVTESYMKEGVFDPDGMIRMLTEETENALNGGYNALRVTGEMSWALRGLPGSERLIEYETKLNKFFPNNQSLAICQYDCRVFEPEILLDILTTHPIAVLGTEIYQNFYYIPTEDFLAGKAPEITLEHWTENLKLRRKMEEELFASGKKYHDLFDHLSSGVAVYEGVNNGEDFILKDMNPAAENIEHVRKENIIGKGVTEAFPGVKDFGIFKVFQRVWKTGKREYFPENIYKDEKDQGSWRENWVYKMPTGEIVSICNDITDRKKVELALKNSEEKYRQLVENAQEGIWSIDAETKTTFVNQRMAEILGYDVDEMLGKPLFSFMDETGVKLAKYNLERNQNGVKEQHDFEFIRKDGKKVYTSIETSPILDADGNYDGSMAVVADVTERNKMEQELLESEERYSITLDAVNDGLWDWDIPSGDAFFSPNYYKLLGYDPGEFPANYASWRFLVHPMDVDSVEKELSESVKSGRGFDIDLRMKTKLNQWLWVSIRGKAVEKDSAGNIIRMVGTLSDITRRKNVELALKDSEEKYRQLVENAQEGIWSIDAETKTTFVNQRMAEILGYDVDEMLEKPLFSFMDETGVKLAKYNLERREKGIKEQHDFEFIRKDGNRVYASLETSPILDADGKYLGALAMVADITDRRKMEEEIKKSLEEKEILLKEIHHRVKNNLMIISSLLNLQSQYIKDKTSKNIFKESQNRARSMALIHERLYQSTDLKRINFGDYIRTLSRELFRIYVADTGLIELNINVEDIFLDINTAIPLGLIVNELITNSLKHAFTEGMKGHINVNFHPQDDHYEFIVTDNGIGFPEDLNFQQTDSLGLQLVNSLTSQIGGKIQLKRNNGAEFKITFKDVGV
jgi:PAS domain S-box-containing protein